ncbi:MAG: alpha-hydroxy acid oxidase [Burkholderiales bacterium]
MAVNAQPLKSPAPAAPRQDPHGLESATLRKIQAENAKHFVSLQEIVAAAHRNLSRSVWDMLSGGSDSEMTLRRNRYALDSLALRQRVMVNVTNIDTTTSLLGQKMPIPVFIAPIGNYLQLADPEGALPVARAAAAKGMPAFISTAAKPGIDLIAQSVPEPMIFQLYIRSDRAWVADILDRAKALGYRALCVTVDRAYYSRRERDMINRLAVREGGINTHQSSLTWDDVVWMKSHMGLPLILKGIATAEDAKLAVEHGADAVYVSNHGGRQLDQAQGSIEVLPEVVQAVDGRAEVLMDGGICRGTDIVKAVALGARAVGVGKLYGWALAAAGQAGVERMIELLEAEIRSTLGLMGVTSLAQLNPSWVRPGQPVLPQGPGITSPFPVFEEQNRG